MELRHLTSFVTAASCESFTRAAKTLHITQAAVSQHIAALERELNTQLFLRVGRAVKITEAGKQLAEYARRILALVDEARDQVGNISRPVQGLLRIAASTIPAEHVLPEMLASFRKRFPLVRESVTISDSTRANQMVEQGEADLGIVGELPRASKLCARAIGSDEMLLVVPQGHVFFGKQTIAPSELNGQPLIVRQPGSGCRRCVEHALSPVGISEADFNIVMEMNSNEAIRAAVVSGVGIAFLSSVVVAREIADRSLWPVRVEGVDASRQLFLVTDQQNAPSDVERAFLLFLDGWAAE